MCVTIGPRWQHARLRLRHSAAIDDLLASDVTLPARQLVRRTSKLHPRPDVGSVPRVTHILIIEDDRDIGDLIRQVLSDEGYDLTFVDGLDRAPAGAAPDLVITDLVGVRPYASGPARAWVRRVTERYPAAPIIVCTAHQPAFQELDRLGAAALLGKPFTIEELLRTVDGLIAR